MSSLFKKLSFIAILLLWSDSSWSTESKSCSLPEILPKIFLAADQHTIPWNKIIGFKETENTLKNGKIISIRPLGEAQEEVGKKLGGTHTVFKIIHENGTEAIWKPSVSNSADGEVSAYQEARLVKSRQVPPTVKRIMSEEGIDLKGVKPEIWEEVKNIEGSSQYYVPSSIDLIAYDEKAKEALKQVSKKELSDQKVFYFVFGQWDAHKGNMIIDDTHSLALIDNAAVKDKLKTQYGESPFRRHMMVMPSARNLLNEPATFPFDKAVRLNNPSKEEFAHLLKEKIDETQVESYWKWIATKKDRSMAVVTWKNRVYIQGIGYQNYSTKAEVFSASTLENYRKLNFHSLRNALSPVIDDEQIQDILERRDQLLKAARTTPIIP